MNIKSQLAKLSRIAILLLSTTGYSVTGFSDAIKTPNTKSSTMKNREEMFYKIDYAVNKALKAFDVPGASVGIVVDGELILAKGYGLRDVGKKLPVTEETIFAIGSCTKAFTTFVLGVLVDKGLIEWDDLVVKHLPEFRLMDINITNKITIRDLVTHRSGLPRHDFLWYGSDGSMKDFFSKLQHLDFVCDLREKFNYNNLMYGVAGIVVEKVTGKSWEDNVKQLIFEPLGMDNSNLFVEESKNNDNFSMPYETKNEIVQEIPFRICNVGPAGSINSNIVDMANWLKLQLSDGAFLDKKLIEKTTLKQMHTIQIASGIAQYPEDKSFALGYGLGWFIENYSGHYAVSHGGGIDGFISETALFPQEKIGVVILSNSTTGGGHLVHNIRKTIFDLLFGLEETDWVEKASTTLKEAELAKKKADAEAVETPSQSKPSHKLEDYVGEYEHPGYGIAKITLEAEKLVLTYNGIVTPLQHKCYDTFNGSKDAESCVFKMLNISFQASDSGDIAEMHMPFELKPIVFNKKASSEFMDREYLEQFANTYSNEQTTIEVSLKGNQLIATAFGQEFPLEPEKKDTFSLKGMSGFTVHFIFDEARNITGLQAIQPNGIFYLKVKK
jgi:CubicO group peptidase (beta-lactamase class C family)